MAAKVIKVEMNVRVWRTETFSIQCKDEVTAGNVLNQIIVDPNKLWDQNYELTDSEDWDSQIESIYKMEVYDA